MRIVYLSNSMIPSRQANSVHVVSMASAIAQNGHKITLYAYQNQNDPLLDAKHVAEFYGVPAGFEIEYINERRIPARSSISALSLAFLLKKQKPDLIIGRHPKGCALSALAGNNVIFETHQPVAWYPSIDRLCIKLAMKLKSYKGIVTISNPLHKILTQETGYNSTDILTTHDGATANEGANVEEMGPKTRLQVGYLGHLYTGRGIEIIVDLSMRLPHMDFHLVGGAEEDIIAWKAKLVDIPNIKLHGFVAPARAAAMRQGCDILLAPYQENTSIPGGRVTSQWMSPLKIFEYMSTGKSIVASDLPVLHEVLQHGKNCLLVAPNDINEWETALRTLEKDDHLASSIGQTALADFEEKYTWKKRACKIIMFSKRI